MGWILMSERELCRVEALQAAQPGRQMTLSRDCPASRSGAIPIPVLACSATKRPDPHCIPALARYDGPLWRTLRAADPEGRAAKVAFLSARYGFRDAATPIVDCDARLTQDLADRMIAGAEIASLTRHGAEPFAEIALVGGRLYVAVMHALVRGFVEMGCVRRDARVSVINGPINRMRQDLRAWLAADDSRRSRP